jgi:hypothetical protein
MSKHNKTNAALLQSSTPQDAVLMPDTGGTSTSGKPGHGGHAGEHGSEHEDAHGAAHDMHGPGGEKGVGGAGDVYSFTLTDGKVTAASMQVPSGNSVNLPLNTGVTYSVSGKDIVATRTDSQGIETLRYSDTDADNLFEVVARARVMTAAPGVDMHGFSNREQLSVTLDGSTVKTVSETLHDGSSKVLLSDTVSSTAQWSVQNGLLIESKTNAAGVTRWEIFRDGNHDGTYTEVAQGHGALIDLVGVISATDAVATSL